MPIKYAIKLKDLRDSFVGANNAYILFKLSISVFGVFACILKDIFFIKKCKGPLLTRVW
jgi:hypothetical protein